jgi:hypothetical protein
VATAGGDDNFNSHGMSSPDGGEILIGDTELRIQQSAVDIKGEEPDGKRCHKKV